MPKSVISTFIVIGLLLLLIGIFFGKGFVIFGLLLIAVGLAQGLSPDGTLRREQVSETWTAFINNAQGRSNDIFQDAEIAIKTNNVPSLTAERKNFGPGMISGLLGKTREFLVITMVGSDKLRPFQFFLNARDFGNNLDVSWYLTYRPTLLQALISLLPFVKVSSDPKGELDLFELQDMRAYSTVVHHGCRDAVDKVMLSLNQDPSKIDRTSRGFLGIS